jgi:hypothetical protein
MMEMMGADRLILVGKKCFAELETDRKPSEMKLCQICEKGNLKRPTHVISTATPCQRLCFTPESSFMLPLYVVDTGNAATMSGPVERKTGLFTICVSARGNNDQLGIDVL